MRISRSSYVLLFVLWMAVAIVAPGCGKDQPGGGGAQPEPVLTPTEAPVVDATQLMDQYAAKAQTEITKSNAASTLDALRKEVEADKE